MEYKNDTGKNVKYRTGSMKDCIWKTIKAGETKEVPDHIAESFGLTKTGDEEKHYEGGSENNTKTKQETEEDKQAPGTLQKEEYKQKLIAIKGVGNKSAEQIIEKYPSEKDLIKAIEMDEEIHKHDGVDKVIKEQYLESLL